MAYELVAFGTSVMWGQGLRDEHKIHAYVKEILESSGKLPPDAMPIHTCLLAHSGAVVGFNDDDTEDTEYHPRVHGEVPTPHPTVLQQLAEYDQSAEAVAPEQVDAVLLEGSINDVNIITILGPLTSPFQLKRRIKRYCYRHMVLLLRRTAAQFPNARIVVPSYYQMLSPESENTYISQFVRALGANWAGRLIASPLKFLGNLAKRRMLKNSRLFCDQSLKALRAAVEMVNAELGGEARIFLAESPFTSRNTAFAPEPWLFAMNADLSPQDELAEERSSACDQAGVTRTVVPICKAASNGHPNQKGARAYAEVIAAALLRDWSPTATTAPRPQPDVPDEMVDQSL